MFRLKTYDCFRNICLAAAVIAAAGCNKEFDEMPGGSGVLTIRIESPSTRGAQDSPGEDSQAHPYNENTINTLDLFFYTPDAVQSGNAAATLHKHIGNVDGNEVTVPLNELNRLISKDEDTSFQLYAVVNCKEAAGKQTPTVAELKALATKADAEYNPNNEDTFHAFRSPVAPKDFVMTNFIGASGTVVTFKPDDRQPRVTVPFKRVAAKIRVAVDVVESIVQNGKTWTPDLEDMRLFINNGVRKARLDGDVSQLTLNDDLGNIALSDYYRIMTSGSQSETSDYTMSRALSFHESNNLIAGKVDDKYTYYNDIPLYTYPNAWSESMTEDHRTTLTIVVPWVTGEGDEREYQPNYYSVPVTAGTEIVSNAYYYIRLYVGMKGSETPEKPFEAEPELEILDWGKADETSVALRPLRILQFNQKEYTIANKNSISIPFISTHNTTVTSCTGTFYLYNASDGLPVARTFDKNIGTYGSSDGSQFGKGKFFYYDIDNDTNTLYFEHDFFNIWRIRTTSGNKVTRIESRSSQNGDYHKFCSKFEITITVRHNTGQAIDAAYEETINLTFYPPIYVDVEKHSVNQGTDGRSDDRGFVYVNGTDISGNNLAGVYGKRGDETVCMTIISISQLDDEDKASYVIGDPRSYYINNNMSDASMTTDIADNKTLWTTSSTGRNAPAAATGRPIWYYGNHWWDSAEEESNPELPDTRDRTLRYYYPTKELADTKNMIAPKFRIVSGYAYLGLNALSREGARRRCASYQEYGYPAGRWRVPTRAELLFLIKLSKTYNIIPKLFAAGDYWHAHGQIDGGNSNDKTATGTAYVRCVYDDWYWENVDGTPDKIPYDDYNNPNSNQGEVRSNMNNYTVFTLGDRPKENPQAQELINAYKTGALH